MKISFEEAFSHFVTGNLIDIRDEGSYIKGHIPSAIHIYSNELLYHTSKYLDRSKVYYLYCDYGYISDDISRRLNQMGYHTFSIIGGYRNYLLR